MYATSHQHIKSITRHAARWLLLCTLFAADAPALAAEDIVVGQIAPFAATPEVKAAFDGAKACLEQVNRSGGLRGRKLTMFGIDDEIKPALAQEKFRDAIAKRPIALLNVTGSAMLGEILASKALDTHDVVIIGAIPGAEAFRNPGHPRLFHIRSGDKAQLERILVHSKTLGIQNVHVLYQDVAIGQSGLAVLQTAAQMMGGITVTSTGTAIAHEALKAAVHKAADAKGQAYIVIGFPQFMADAFAQLRKAGVRQAVFALGYLTPALAIKAAGIEGARGLGLTQAIPNPNGRTLPLQREFHAAMQQSPAKADEYLPFHLEGCVAARVLVEGLRRIDGPLTPAALAKSLHTMGELNFGGFSVRFGDGQVGSVWSDIGVMSESGRLIF